MQKTSRELLERAVGYHQAGKLDAAETHYKRYLNRQPDNFEARHLFGVLRFQQGRTQEAINLITAALKSKPDFPQALYSLGNIYSQTQRYAEALESYDRALALQPGFAEALCNRGNALLKLNSIDDAIASFDRALALQPRSPEALNGRGNALLGLRRYPEALASFERALSLQPNAPGALYNRGNALKALGRFREAIESYDKALALASDFIDARVNRAEALALTGQYDRALADYETVLTLEPANMEAARGMTDAALNLCDWQRVAKIAAALPERAATIHPFTLLGYCDDPMLQRQRAERHAFEAVPVLPPPLATRARTPGEKICIAYVSADFQWHATAYLAAELFEQHDRSRFRVLGFSLGADDGSPMRRRLIKAFDEFHDVQAKSDEEVAKLLHGRGVDIAIDLKGYTHEARPQIFSHRPAPLQVSYLGYPGTLGSPFIDYILADKVVAPFEHEAYYSEKIVHLPDCYQVNDATRAISPVTPTRQEAGLPDNGFVFCCFNRNYKIAEPLFDIWMRLLKAVPDSVLWLLRSNAGAEANLRSAAAARGVDPARLVFADRKEPEDHLARHRLADLFLDTLPYNAHTTASDALWAGLPVLTCQGAAFPARVSSSLLEAIGLSDLITDNLAAYEALALRLAREPQTLAGMRERLAQNRLTYPLFDAPRFRRHIEAAYARMWEIWQHGQPPRHFSVEAAGGVARDDANAAASNG